MTLVCRVFDEDGNPVTSFDYTPNVLRLQATLLDLWDLHTRAIRQGGEHYWTSKVDNMGIRDAGAS